jgi:hypothetical protein
MGISSSKILDVNELPCTTINKNDLILNDTTTFTLEKSKNINIPTYNAYSDNEFDDSENESPCHSNETMDNDFLYLAAHNVVHEYRKNNPIIETNNVGPFHLHDTLQNINPIRLSVPTNNANMLHSNEKQWSVYPDCTRNLPIQLNFDSTHNNYVDSIMIDKLKVALDNIINQPKIIEKVVKEYPKNEKFIVESYNPRTNRRRIVCITCKRVLESFNSNLNAICAVCMKPEHDKYYGLTEKFESNGYIVNSIRGQDQFDISCKTCDAQKIIKLYHKMDFFFPKCTCTNEPWKRLQTLKKKM